MLSQNSSEGFGKISGRCKRQEVPVFWQRNPLSIALWTKEVFMQQLEYIQYTPVAAGLCTFAEEYGLFVCEVL
jgi:hypothetical protein